MPTIKTFPKPPGPDYQPVVRPETVQEREAIDKAYTKAAQSCDRRDRLVALATVVMVESKRIADAEQTDAAQEMVQSGHFERIRASSSVFLEKMVQLSGVPVNEVLSSANAFLINQGVDVVYDLTERMNQAAACKFELGNASQLVLT